MTESTVASALDYYARIGAALFPIPAGRKEPFGIVTSFTTDNSRDPAQWATWLAANPGCNWGIVAGPSRLIIVDIDTKEGREAAWALWCEMCASWGLPAALMPHVQSARGGWHVLFAVPADVDATTLRQPDAIKKLINIRAGNGFTVAAGSFYDGTPKGEESGPYMLLSDVAPYPAPSALVQHCTRKERMPGSVPGIGSRDAGDVANLVKWLAERDQFNDYESWYQIGAALKIELGDSGFEIWELATWSDAKDDLPKKWESFATEPTAQSVTLNTFLQRAHALGWRGSVRKSAAGMFDNVAALAAAAGASLPTGNASGSIPLPTSTPGPDGGIPMLAGQEKLCELSEPIVSEFMAATIEFPNAPITTDYPVLPDSMNGHGLFVPMQEAIARMIAMAERDGAKMRGSRVIDAAAVLSIMHRDVFDSVMRRLRSFGVATPDAKIKLAGAALADRVERAFVTQDDWIYDVKGQIEHNNSDNIAVFLGILGCEVRWNAWTERAEIRGDEWKVWTYVDDTVHAKLSMRASRTKTRFLPSDAFLWKALIATARANEYDPVLERLAEVQTAWDGTPRLSVWLSAACGVPCDLYHQAVARNIIGGMVRRARSPGCKHDTMPVFFGHQGTGKSTIAKIIADMGQSSLSDITRGKGQFFTDTVKLGDEAKELVLSLAGKCVAEIAEMGKRNSTDIEHIKAMVSRDTDAGRTAYARSVTERPRRNIFFGTANGNAPLSDPTGNRRFLPVRVNAEINLEWIHANIAQIVGEAATLESKGEDFAIPRDVWALAAEMQEAAREQSDTEIMFADWFAVTEHTAHAFITASDLRNLVNDSGLRCTNSTRGLALRNLRFHEGYATVDGKKSRAWVRGNVADAIRFMVGIDPRGRVHVTIRTNSHTAPIAPPLPPVR
jgi:predicted P-loop ATPase